MKRLLLENLGLKALALVLAACLWAYVGSRQVLERKMTLRLEWGDLPAGMALDPNIKTSIQTVLTGRKESLLELNTEDLKAVVSLRAAQPGQKELVVRPKVQPLPEGVTAVLPDLTVHLVSLPEPEGPSKKKKKRK